MQFRCTAWDLVAGFVSRYGKSFSPWDSHMETYSSGCRSLARAVEALRNPLGVAFFFFFHVPW